MRDKEFKLQKFFHDYSLMTTDLNSQSCGQLLPGNNHILDHCVLCDVKEKYVL